MQFFFFLPLPEKVSFETCGLHSMMKCLQKTVQVMNGLKENGSDTENYTGVSRHNAQQSMLSAVWKKGWSCN